MMHKIIIMKMAVLNFIQGNGPYCRMAELAFFINKRLKEAGREPLGFIMPLVAGDKQKKILQEELETLGENFSGYIFFDPSYGAALAEIFFKGGDYNEELIFFSNNQAAVEKKIQGYFRQEKIIAEKFNGDKVEIERNDIIMELNRNPRLSTGVMPGYSTSIGLFSQMIKEGQKEGFFRGTEGDAANRAIMVARNIEKKHRSVFLSEPSVFLRPDTEGGEIIMTPPLMAPPEKDTSDKAPGIYVVLSGISGLEGKYYEKIKQLEKKYKIYTNRPDYFENAEYAPPRAVSNDNIILEIGRSGWSSVWLPMIFAKPFIALPYLHGDDPEIYFNLKTIEELRLGAVWQEGESFASVFRRAEECVPYQAEFKARLLKKYNTLNGFEICAKKIVNDFYGI